MQSDGRELDNVSKQSGKLRRVDIMLIEILREKKRKGLVDDYFKAMEMKLIELLDYILQDEPEYQEHGLSSSEKMKEVLRNLEKFKGRTTEGEPKVNLLRIFFEEFRNLKQEREANHNSYSGIHKRELQELQEKAIHYKKDLSAVNSSRKQKTLMHKNYSVHSDAN